MEISRKMAIKKNTRITKRTKPLHKNAWKTKFNQDAYLDTYTITAVRNCGTARDCNGKVTDIFNMRNNTLHKE